MSPELSPGGRSWTGADQANAAKDQPVVRQVIRCSRWLLLRNRDNLKVERSVKFDELLVAANPPLAFIYLPMATLKKIWFAPSIREGFRK